MPPQPASKRFTVSLHDSPPWHGASKRFIVSLHDSPLWHGALYAVAWCLVRRAVLLLRVLLPAMAWCHVRRAVLLLHVLLPATFKVL